MVRIAFADKYFSSLLALTPKEQSQVNKAVMLFQQDPQHSGLHYEKLNTYKDQKLRSIRANQDVRIILAVAPKEDLYLMLYVDHHEPAYKWAENRRIKVNSETGDIQVFAVIEHESTVVNSTQTTQKTPGVFDQIKDKHLLQLGVPHESLQVIRTITIEAELENARDDDVLPQEAYEGLFMIMAGASFEEAYQEVVPEPVTESVDTDNFTAALVRAESLAHFTVAENEDELRHVLEQSIEKWRVFLHPKQRRLASGHKNGPVRVLGGAGTGKTVVAMHRTKWLAENVASPQHKVLFTTFTRNLAADIRDNLTTICSQKISENIDVSNLDAWVMNYLKKQGYDYGLLMNARQEEELWETAYSEKSAESDLSLAFFKDEWAHVIQPQSIDSTEEYKRASRIGRGTRLNRAQRIGIWPVFAEYRRLLSQNQLKETDDAYRDARALMEADETKRPDYTAIIVDEAQDMGTQAFKLLRAMIPKQANDLFIVGDGHQRIYGKNKVVLGQCGIEIRGRSARLKINYRTTEETRLKAVSILDGVEVDDLDGGMDSQQYYHSLMHGPAPVVQEFNTIEEECDAILEHLKRLDSDPNACCVIARTRREVTDLERFLNSKGQLCRTLDGNPVTSVAGTLNLATMHRVKGLEFDTVFLASANEGMIPLQFVLDKAGDPITRKQSENEERALVYVSLTRARRESFVFGYGRMSPWFK